MSKIVHFDIGSDLVLRLSTEGKPELHIQLTLDAALGLSERLVEAVQTNLARTPQGPVQRRNSACN
jgi:hypothetical protein